MELKYNNGTPRGRRGRTQRHKNTTLLWHRWRGSHPAEVKHIQWIWTDEEMVCVLRPSCWFATTHRLNQLKWTDSQILWLRGQKNMKRLFPEEKHCEVIFMCGNRLLGILKNSEEVLIICIATGIKALLSCHTTALCPYYHSQWYDLSDLCIIKCFTHYTCNVERMEVKKYLCKFIYTYEYKHTETHTYRYKQCLCRYKLQSKLITSSTTLLDK